MYTIAMPLTSLYTSCNSTDNIEIDNHLSGNILYNFSILLQEVLNLPFTCLSIVCS